MNEPKNGTPGESETIEIDFAGNVLSSIADVKKLPMNQPIPKIKHAIVVGFAQVGHVQRSLQNGLINLHHRVAAVEEVLAALDSEGKLAVSDALARKALNRIVKTVKTRAADPDEDAASRPAEGEGGQAS